MKTATIITIETILEADRTIPKAKREKVMDILLDRAPPQPIRKKDLITTKQAAEILEIHPVTLRRHAKAGHINVIRYSSRKIRFDRTEIIAYANGEKMKPE